MSNGVYAYIPVRRCDSGLFFFGLYTASFSAEVTDFHGNVRRTPLYRVELAQWGP